MQFTKSVISICRFVYPGREHPAIGSWLAATCHKMDHDPTIQDIHEFYINQYPLPAARNSAVLEAQNRKATHIVMVDAADMHPDYLAGAPAFWDTAWKHIQTRPRFVMLAPCVVSAPARAKDGSVCVSKVVEDAGPDGEPRRHLRRMSAEDAIGKRGVEQVPAINVALSVIDMQCFDKLTPPWFVYEYTDVFQNQLAGTEDVLFTSRLAAVGVPSYCAWDSWNGHGKEFLLGKPGAGDVGTEVREHA